MSDANANSGGGAFGWLKWAMELLFSKDKDIGLYLLAGLVVLFTIIMTVQSGVSADGFNAFAWTVGRILAIVAVVVILFRSLRGSVMVRVLANTVVVVGLVFIVLGFAQFLTGSMFHPPVPQAACFANPLQQVCQVKASEAVETAATRDVPEAPPEPEPLVVQSTSVSGGEVVSEEMILTAPPFVPPANEIFVQFAGQISREEVTEVSMALAADGWQIQGADRGGERTGVAAGLNEIRYFRAEDEQAAIDLARAYAEAAPWLGVDALILRDLSNSGLSPRFEGQLEIWTSP